MGCEHKDSRAFFWSQHPWTTMVTSAVKGKFLSVSYQSQFVAREAMGLGDVKLMAAVEGVSWFGGWQGNP